MIAAWAIPDVPRKLKNRIQLEDKLIRDIIENERQLATYIERVEEQS